jgi:O-antigen ligase
MIIYVHENPYMKKKYNDVTFNNLDKIGKLDEVKNAQAKLCNSLVTRLSIWKSTLELIHKKPIIGYGASGSKEILFNYYKSTNQKFLYFNKFPVHNQFLDFTLKFGFIGFFIVTIYIGFIGYLGIKINNPIIISFFVIFFLSNLTDDFLIRFDGIVYSGFWITLFTIEFIKTRESAKIKESISC